MVFTKSGMKKGKRRFGQKRRFFRKRRGYFKLLPKITERGPERKFFDVDVSQNVTAASNAVLANPIPQGAGDSQRVGKMIRLKSIYLHGQLALNGAGLGQYVAQSCRVIIYLDKQPNFSGSTLLGANASTSRVLAAAAPGAGANSETVIMSANELSNKERFVVIYDKIFSLFPPAAGTDCRLPFRIYKKLDTECSFSDTGGAIGSLSSGALYVATVGTQGTAGNGYAVAYMISRVRYSDV